MADFNDNSQKGSTLMQQALKKYAEGDFEGGEKDRKEANRYFDMFYAEINSEAGKMSQLYGESRNFGIIYNVFEQNIADVYQDKDKKMIIKEGFNLIKNNSILNEQFKIYDMFEKIDNVENAKEFVNEAVSLIKHFDKQEVKENNEKLINFIKKNKLDEYVEIPEETENLYEAIEYIILNEKKLDNINDFIKAQNVIVEHIQNDKKTINENEEKITFEDFKNNLEKQEEELNENINEDEKKLLDMFVNPKTNKKAVFENYKKQTLEKINDMLQTSENEDKESWNKIYESVNSKTYSDKMTQNIINCAEMLEICSTIEE